MSRSPSGDFHDASPASPGNANAPSGALARFWHECARSLDTDSLGDQLLPARLARACAVALEVDGVGISVLESDFRIPLGASDDMAGYAERLQFTQGQGPCLDAVSEGRTLVVGSDVIAERWPQFADALFGETNYRGVITLPLSIMSSTKGALDMFFVDETKLRTLRLADAADVSAAVAQALRDADALEQPDASSEWSDDPMPGWLAGTTANHRRFVWFAIGMTMARFDVSGADALALLRAYAYGHDEILDQVALDLVDGRLLLTEIRN